MIMKFFNRKVSIFTPKGLLIGPYGDFVSGLITSPPVVENIFVEIESYSIRFFL